MLPNFIIAGVVKGGTTSIFRYLAGHPEVCASSIKESCYFLPIRYGGLRGDIAEYEKLFCACKDELIRMESTPGYFNGNESLPREIKNVLGDIKVIIVLREPVSRFVSFFGFMKSSLLLPKELSIEDYFNQCLSQNDSTLRVQDNDRYYGLEGGCYSKYLPYWKSAFGENLKVMFFDGLKVSPESFMREVSNFIGIDAAYFDGMEFESENKTRAYKYRWLHASAIGIYKLVFSRIQKYEYLRKKLLYTYYLINGSALSTNLSDSLLEKLNAYYQPYNKALRSIVDEQEVPNWLKNA